MKNRLSGEFSYIAYPPKVPNGRSYVERTRFLLVISPKRWGLLRVADHTATSRTRFGGVEAHSMQGTRPWQSRLRLRRPYRDD